LGLKFWLTTGVVYMAPKRAWPKFRHNPVTDSVTQIGTWKFANSRSRCRNNDELSSWSSV